MEISLKYARIERERRFLLSSIPDGVFSTKQIVDRYVAGTRLRLREVHNSDGTVVRKLGQKIRLSDGPEAVACTNFYLDDAEWKLLVELSSTVLRKTRHIVERDGFVVAVDEFVDGTLVAEIDDSDTPSEVVPDWLSVVQDVSQDDNWTGARLAERLNRPE